MKKHHAYIFGYATGAVAGGALMAMFLGWSLHDVVTLFLARV